MINSHKQGWGEYWTYEYEYWKISTRVVLEYNIFSIFMFIILGKTSTRVVLAPALAIRLPNMPVYILIATCPLKTPHIPSSYSNEQTTKETKAINNSYIYTYLM